MSKYSENIPSSIIGAIGWFYDDIANNSIVLDVGCSTGYYGAYIKENKKCSVYGIEVSNDKKVAEKVLDGVYSFDLDGTWPEYIYERKYDIIFLGDVIEHLKDPELVLGKLSKLLNRRGKVFISTPNVAHISTRLELLGGNFEYEKMGILDSTHLKYFTLNSLTKLVQDSGYHILRIDSSESDYPKEITESILEKYGLTANDTFWKMMAKPEARAFQYKLVLESQPKNQKPYPIPPPTKKPEQYKADFISDLREEVKRSEQELKDLSIEYDKVIKENEEIGKVLNEILHSKAYKLSQKLQTTKSKTYKVIGK